MARDKKRSEKVQKPLDTLSGKRRRGRPGIRPSLISGRSYNYGLILSQIWNDMKDAQEGVRKGVGEALLKARTTEEVIRAFDPWPSYQRDFEPMASLILEVLRDPKFPKRPEPQRNFLADSLGGWGLVSARRSRDICEEERKKEREKSRFRILRWEFYIVCSCKYKGPSFNHACPKCGSEVSISGTMFDDTLPRLHG